MLRKKKKAANDDTTEVSLYLGMDPISKHQEPLLWWKSIKDVYPEMFCWPLPRGVGIDAKTYSLGGFVSKRYLLSVGMVVCPHLSQTLAM
jgi:hypothetical protein